jgi:NAD(P)-dependent dehydrogenase (short-subunit alcohol dehydrogenase family)
VTRPATPAPLVVVAGGTGSAARRTVDRLLADGCRVVVPTRGPDRARSILDPDRTRSGLGLVEADIGSEPGVEQLARDVADRYGAVNHVIVAVGGWVESAPVPDLSLAEFTRTLSSHLVPHLLLAAAFAPRLAGPSPCFLCFAGIAGWVPHPHALPVSVAGAGQRMLVDTLAAQPLGDRVRFRELVVWPPILETEDARVMGIAEYVPGAEVAAAAAAVIRGEEPAAGVRLHLGRPPSNPDLSKRIRNS